MLRLRDSIKNYYFFNYNLINSWPVFIALLFLCYTEIGCEWIYFVRDTGIVLSKWQRFVMHWLGAMSSLLIKYPSNFSSNELPLPGGALVFCHLSSVSAFRWQSISLICLCFFLIYLYAVCVVHRFRLELKPKVVRSSAPLPLPPSPPPLDLAYRWLSNHCILSHSRSFVIR